MEPLELLLVIALPALGLLVLSLTLRRWGRKHDPMSGHINDRWRTTGTTTRFPDDDERNSR